MLPLTLARTERTRVFVDLQKVTSGHGEIRVWRHISRTDIRKPNRTDLICLRHVVAVLMNPRVQCIRIHLPAPVPVTSQLNMQTSLAHN